MAKFTRHDEPLSITATLYHNSVSSFTAQNSLVASAFVTDTIDGDERQRLVDQAVGFKRAQDVAYKLNQYALGYRAPGVRPRGPQ